jgi:hypothetical protein
VKDILEILEADLGLIMLTIDLRKEIILDKINHLIIKFKIKMEDKW